MDRLTLVTNLLENVLDGAGVANEKDLIDVFVALERAVRSSRRDRDMSFGRSSRALDGSGSTRGVHRAALSSPRRNGRRPRDMPFENGERTVDGSGGTITRWQALYALSASIRLCIDSSGRHSEKEALADDFSLGSASPGLICSLASNVDAH